MSIKTKKIVKSLHSPDYILHNISNNQLICISALNLIMSIQLKYLCRMTSNWFLFPGKLMHGWIYGAFVKATASLSVMLLRRIYLIDWDQRTVRKCVITYQRWVLEKAVMLQTLSGPPQINIKSHWLFRRVSLCACFFFHFFFFCFIDLTADLMVHQSLQELIWPQYYDPSTER